MLQPRNSNNIKMKTTNGSNNRRKKLWQIPQVYHCAIIGTCLSRKDLQLLARKKIFQLTKNTSDYEIHKIFSNEADKRSDKARILHKYLETKHKAAIKKYTCCNDAVELENQWRDDLSRNNVAGAFWAILTHPMSTPQIISLAYGDCHMLSFDIFANQQQQNRQLQALRSQITQQQKKLSEKQKKHDQLLTEKERLREENNHLKTQANLDSDTIIKATKTINDLKQELEYLRLHQENDHHRQLLAEQEKNQILNQNITKISSDNRHKSELLRLSKSKVERLETLLSELRQQNREQEQELSNMKTALMFHQADKVLCTDCDYPHHPRETCEKLNTEQCKGPDLCGKTVLYVGGLHKMIPRYREIIENHGGKFLHHDGGKENSKQMLPKLLGGADAVVCPIDCVSHDACKCVKKICKRYEKPFVMMRSSGLSSLAKELNNIC